MRQSLLVAGLAALIAARQQRYRRLRRKTRQALRRFTVVPDLDLFEVARPQLAMGGPCLPHAVLLLHGFSASPYEFNRFIPALAEAGIPSYAPLLTGHGLTSLRLMDAVEPADWLRDAIQAYDLLATLAEQVSVFGHSTGAALAVYVAQQRKVKHLVLSGPNLIPSATYRRRKAFLQLPGGTALLHALSPLVGKPVQPGRVSWVDILDPAAAGTVLSYAALPPAALRAQWTLQECIAIAQARYQSLTIGYGAHDLTVDTTALLQRLDRMGLAYSARAFPASGHNILQDYDWQAATAYLAGALQQR